MTVMDHNHHENDKEDSLYTSLIISAKVNNVCGFVNLANQIDRSYKYKCNKDPGEFC